MNNFSDLTKTQQNQFIELDTIRLTHPLKGGFIGFTGQFKSELKTSNKKRVLRLINIEIGDDFDTWKLSKGSLISTASWPEVQKNDKTTVRLFLPPEMTGQREALILQGPAVVKRVEEDRGGIVLQFTKQLKTFDVSR